MSTTIIAGSDGYDRGRGAVAHGSSSWGGHHDPPLPFPDTHAGAREQLHHALAAVRNELAPQATIRLEADMSPAHGLRCAVADERADLLIVGSRHRRRLQRIVETDHAMQVLHGAPCAVAVAPDPVDPKATLRCIGAGLEDTPSASRRWTWRASSPSAPGSRRWGPVKRLALGSTSDDVIRHAACPVLVPPRHATTEHGSGPAVADEVSSPPARQAPAGTR